MCCASAAFPPGMLGAFTTTRGLKGHLVCTSLMVDSGSGEWLGHFLQAGSQPGR